MGFGLALFYFLWGCSWLVVALSSARAARDAEMLSTCRVGPGRCCLSLPSL